MSGRPPDAAPGAAAAHGYGRALVEDDDAPDLRHYLVVLRRRKWSIAVATVLAAGAAVGLSLLQDPVYAARSQILVEVGQRVDPLADQVTNAQVAQRQLNNKIRELESAEVRDAARRAYAGPLDVESVHGSVAASDADVIDVEARAGDPAEVARLVNTYVEAYVRYRTERELEELGQLGATIREKANQLQQKIADLQAPVREMDERIASVATSTRLSAEARQQQLSALQAQRDERASEVRTQVTPLEAQHRFYQEQLDKLEVSSQLRQGGTLRVVAPARVPSDPVSPKPVRNGVLGAALGLLLGVGLAFLRDYLDDTVRDKEGLEEVTGLPTVGVIPRTAGKRTDALPDVVTVTAPTSPAAEAYRTLRTSVKFLSVEGDVKVIQVTSPTAGEGKTLTALNLGVALAQAGDRVVVVGCDLRRPRLDRMAHVEGPIGLTSVLLGEESLSNAMSRHDDEPRLSVLRTGPQPPNPSELLGGGRMKALVEALRTHFDVVILDCPPVLPVSDALVVSRYADITLVLANEGRTSKRGLHRTMELLHQVDAPVRGAILNEAHQGGGRYGAYGYGYGYEPDEAPARRGGTRGGGGEPPAQTVEELAR